MTIPILLTGRSSLGMNFFSSLQKGIRIIVRRFQIQGFSTTILWMYGRGLPAVTGIPLLKFSKVTPYLFVGPQFRKNGKRHLEANGINACVNMRIEKDDVAYGLALDKYLHLPTIDDEAPSIEQLTLGVDFIRQIINSGGKVYIHCGAGVGRAPSMAAAYLMAEGASLSQAIKIIQKARPFITITPPQMTRLVEYEAICLCAKQ